MATLKQPLIQNDSLQDEIEIANLISPELKERSSRHEAGIKECKRLMSRVRLIGLLISWDFFIRNNILVLYVRTLDDCPNTTTIGLVVGFSFIIAGLTAIVNGIIGDAWRFDYLLCITVVIYMLTFWIEAASSEFWVFGVAYLIGGQQIQALVTGFLIKILPLYYAKEFQFVFSQFFILGALFGPVLGGIISYFISYRAVFLLCASVMTILSIGCLVYIRGISQQVNIIQMQFEQLYNDPDTIKTQLELKKVLQNFNFNFNSNFNSNSNSNSAGYSEERHASSEDISKLEKMYQGQITDDIKWLISNDYKFPMLLHQNKTTTTTTATTTTSNNDDNIDDDDDSSRSKYNFLKLFGNVSKYRALLLILISLMQAISQSNQSTFATWFTVYIEDKYNGTVLESTGMLSFAALMVLAGTIVVQIVTKKMQIQRDLTTPKLNSNSSLKSYKNYNNSTNNRRYSWYSKINWYLFHNETKFNFQHYLVFILIVTLVFGLILTFWIIPDNAFGFSYKYSFWIYISFVGFVLGANIVSLVLMTVSLAPHGATGRVWGVKTFIIHCVKAFGILFVGILWDESHEWLWYSTGLLGIVQLILLLIVAGLEQSNWYQI